MKKILFLFAATAIFLSCNNQNKDGKSDDSTVLTFATDIENVDSLALLVPATWKNLGTITDTLAHSGKNSSKIDTVAEYSVVYENKLGNISKDLPKKVKVSAYGCSLAPGSKAIIVCSISNDKYYGGAVTDSVFNTTNEWKEITAEFGLPNNLSSEDVIKTYIWNKKVGTFLVDDMKVEFFY
ncbi:MAG TPA: hypothetical protein VK212_02510 [Lentimicrobium sp.]|nr:hypothetical protein [Lentimicrobium sp.]